MAAAVGLHALLYAAFGLCLLGTEMFAVLAWARTRLVPRNVHATYITALPEVSAAYRAQVWDTVCVSTCGMCMQPDIAYAHFSQPPSALQPDTGQMMDIGQGRMMDIGQGQMMDDRQGWNPEDVMK